MSRTLTTRTAFANWDNRIAPVFDTARQIHVVETESGQIVSETPETLSEVLPVQKTLRLVELGIGTLVCGAISKPMYGLVVAYGIQVIPFVAGDLREVIRAWLGGDLNRENFTMPGCYGRGQGRRQEMPGINRENYLMNGRRSGGMGKGGGMGRGGGQGQGRGQGQGQGQGRMGGLSVAGDVGICLCPKCGHREPHERGVPCVQKQCPKCGTAMVRE